MQPDELIEWARAATGARVAEPLPFVEQPERERRGAAPQWSDDDAAVQTLARHWIEAAKVAKAQGAQQVRYDLACSLRDLGLSPDAIYLLMHAAGGFDYAGSGDGKDLRARIANVFEYAQNPEPGAALERADIQHQLERIREKLAGRTARDVFAAYLEPEPKPDIRNALRQAMFRASDIQPAKIARRRLLLGSALQAGVVSLLVGPGGEGKSLVQLARAFALASGRSITGETLPEGAKRVLYYNAEDPRDEIERRIAAIARYYGVARPANLLVLSGLDLPFDFVVASDNRDGVIVNGEVVETLEQLIADEGIEAAFFDPFVKLHRVPENDNAKVDAVARVFAPIAARFKIPVALTHHVSKAAGDRRDLSANAGRGAGSLKDATRLAEVLYRAPEGDVDALLKADGLALRERFGPACGGAWRYVFVCSAKSNYTPPINGRRWFFLTTVADIGNGDAAGVPVPFEPSRVAEEAEVFLLSELAAHLQEAGNVITLYEAARWLAGQKKPGRGRSLTNIHEKLQKFLKGGREFMLAGGTTVTLKKNTAGNALLYFSLAPGE